MPVLEGVIEREPEYSHTSTGKFVCSFLLEGLRCVAWEDLAENINQHIKVGDKVKVWGYNKERWWTLPNGQKTSEENFTVNRIKVTDRPKPIQGCCYYCIRFNADCMAGCYNALGGPLYIRVCEVKDGKCTNLTNECFEAEV